MNLDRLKQQLKSLTEVTDLTETFDEESIKHHRLMAMAAALPITFWLPLAKKDQSPFVRFHANNGLLLCLSIIAAALLSLLLRLIPAGWLIIFPLWGFLAVESIFSSIDALCGNARELHLIGKLNLKLIK